MNIEEWQMLLEDFEVWMKTKFTDTFRLRGHKFEKTKTDNILVDGGLFTREEAKQFFILVTSHNPLHRLNATLLI